MLIAIPNAFGDAVTNMAIDSALLQSVPNGAALFRHYGWLEPSITFGYSQKHCDVTAHFPEEFTFCRRATGGGIVDHRNDWTYALILHHNHPSASLTPTKLYQRVHQAIQTVLSQRSVATELAPCPRTCETLKAPPTGTTSQCFVTAAADDVLLPSGEKVAGAAMKRSRTGLLLQGSISRAALPNSFPFDLLTVSLAQQFSAMLQSPVNEIEDLRTLFKAPLIAAAREKFESHAWQSRR